MLAPRPAAPPATRAAPPTSRRPAGSPTARRPVTRPTPPPAARRPLARPAAPRTARPGLSGRSPFTKPKGPKPIGVRAARAQVLAPPLGTPRSAYAPAPPTRPAAPRRLARRPSKPVPVRSKAPTPAAPKLVVASARESGWVLLATVTALLIVMGLMMVLSASSVEALRSYGGAWVFFQRQAAWVAVGTAAMVVTALWDYRRWARLAWPLVVASLVLLLAVHIPGVGINVSGSTRWLGFGFFTFQPSEMVKFALLVFVADLLARRCDRMHESRLTLRPVVVVGGVLGGLVLLQPDMGTAMLLVLIVLVELFVAGLPLLKMAAVVVTSTVGALFLAMGAGYRRGRVAGFLDPWGDVSNTGYQVAQSLVALGTGHLAGVGLGASRAKWGFLPNAHTDFIFAIVGEELGLIGTLLVLGLFAAFAVLGIRAAMRAPDRFGMLMATGITAWVVGQALVNMGAVTGMLPVTGVPLPFLSFGGTSLVVSMASVGILLNIARHAVPRPKPA
ncbi:MAG: cell division protein FtsW [Actinomycetota bacterium]|nr:cell division protein FtsW [Actinomycetota bacterium]